MSAIFIHLDFSRNYSHADVISEMSPALKAIPGDDVFFSIDFTNITTLLYSDLLTLIVSLITTLKKEGINVKGNIRIDRKSDHVKYASRINFFKNLGLDIPESFTRNESSGAFTEILEFNQENIYNLQEQINLILHEKANIAKEVLELLYYCLNEIMDNVLVHSGLNHGWVCAQSFAKNKEIRLIICDNGVGIHQSLATSPNPEYANLSEDKALELCIRKGVTNGKGLGFGLFATSMFVKENGGDLLVYSGSYFLRNEGTELYVKEGSRWKGTVVYLRINTEIAVDYKLIMPKDHSLPDDYQDFIDDHFGVNNDLW